jgi:hypothetical protein
MRNESYAFFHMGDGHLARHTGRAHHFPPRGPEVNY